MNNNLTLDVGRLKDVFLQESGYAGYLGAHDFDLTTAVEKLGRPVFEKQL